MSVPAHSLLPFRPEIDAQRLVSVEMSSTMPGTWPTLHDFPDKLGCVDVESSVGDTPSELPRPKIHLGSIRYGVSYSFRRAAMKGFWEDLEAGCAEVLKGGVDVEDDSGVGERGVARQRSNSFLSDTADSTSDSQATPDSLEDVDMALPPFPNLVTKAGETDWAKYLLWMEDDMSFEERTNNNMLLVGNSIREVSSDDVNTHLSLDIEPIGKRRMLLFKDLPAMRQGQHDGLAMYLLGYDAVERVLFVRRFERLSSKIELLPRYWACGKEVVWLSVGRLLQMLRDVDLDRTSTDSASVLPEWDEELGFKVVVVAMFAQWVLDFSGGLRMMTEVAEMAHMLLLRWRDSLLTDCTGATASVPKFEKEKARHRDFEELDTTEGKEIVSVSKSAELRVCATPHISDIYDHKTPSHASHPIAGIAHDKRHIYDSDEEEEWAALQEWVARNKPEKHIETVNAKREGRAATSDADHSPSKALDPNNSSRTPDRVQSPLDTSDVSSLVDTKRFSDASTLCDGVEENKEGLVFTNTVRNAVLNEGSIEAMLRVYSGFVKEHPEHDSEKKRSDLFEFLVAHVLEENGGSVLVPDTLHALKKMGSAEKKEAHAAESKTEFSEGSRSA